MQTAIISSIKKLNNEFSYRVFFRVNFQHPIKTIGDYRWYFTFNSNIFVIIGWPLTHLST